MTVPVRLAVLLTEKFLGRLELHSPAPAELRKKLCHDGTIGARTIHAAGGELLTESERSCVVYGMPRCVDEAGVSAKSLDLAEMPAEILRRI